MAVSAGTQVEVLPVKASLAQILARGGRLAEARELLDSRSPEMSADWWFSLLTLSQAAEAAMRTGVPDVAATAGALTPVPGGVGPLTIAMLMANTLVAACAEAGTDYVDLTGEPEFVDRMFVAHHARARETGARIVHACGFDSIPHDLGAYFTVQQLPSDQPITLRGVVRSGGTFSGGTFHSALNQFSRAREMKKTYAARRRAEVRPEGRSSRAVSGKPHRDPELGYWLLPLPTIDPIVVARSGPAHEANGPQNPNSHWDRTKTLRYAAGGAVGMGALTVASQVKPLRDLLLSRVPQGSGPDPAKREKSWFTVDFVGEAGGRTVRTRVSGGDPGYTETAKMLSEAALCLALDDNPETAGQVTPAQAMGDALLARLQKAGMRFETV